MAETSNDVLVAEFTAKRKIYDEFTESARGVVFQLLKYANILVSNIEDRTKTVESFTDKVSRSDKDGKYGSFSEITDLSGLRIIAFLKTDCDEISKLLRNNFIVDELNSIVKTDDMEPDRFGYQSIHLVLSYRSDRTILPEFARFKDMKVEIQVKTLLQHTWAAIDWKLRYKSKLATPKEVQRRLYRISALLDAADDEFLVVSEDSKNLKETYEKAIKKGNLDLVINKLSVEAFLNSPETKAIVSKLANKLKMPPSVLVPADDSSLQMLLVTASQFKIETLAELRRQVDADVDARAEKIKKLVESWAPGTGTTFKDPQLLVLSLLYSRPAVEAKATLEHLVFVDKFKEAVKNQLG